MPDLSEPIQNPTLTILFIVDSVES